MKGLGITLLSGVLLIAGGVIASAQNATPVSLVHPAPTAGDVTLSSQINSMNNVELEASSVDRQDQVTALAEVRTMLKGGKLSARQAKTVEVALRAIALSGIVNESVSGMTVINNYPYLRMQACALLGKLGGKQAGDTLLQVLMNDHAPMVLAEAAYQLGRFGRNPSNTVSNSIAWVLTQQPAGRVDNNLAFASMLAFEALAKANHGLRDPLVYDAIMMVQSENYIGAVKEKAAQALSELRSYN